MRVCLIAAALGTLASCGVLLGFDDSNPTTTPISPGADGDGATDGANPADGANGSVDGMGSEDAATAPLPTCTTASDCPLIGSVPAECWSNRCVSKVVDTNNIAAPFLGLVALDNVVFVSIPGFNPNLANGKVSYWQYAANANALIDHVGSLIRVGSLARGDDVDEVFFAVGGGIGSTGVYGTKTATQGTSTAKTQTNLDGIRYFARSRQQPDVFYFTYEGQPNIYRVEALIAKEIFHTTFIVRFMEITDDGSTLVFASDQGVQSIRPNDANIQGSAKLLANENQAVGVAIAGAFVYYTNIAGGIRRVPLVGGGIEVVFDALPNAPTMVGDIDISKNVAYWTANSAIYRLGLE